MKNKKAIYGILMGLTLVGIGFSVFYLIKKKGLMQSTQTVPINTLEKTIVEQTPDKIVTEVITTAGEKVINTETIIDGKKQIISEFEDGSTIVIEDADKLQEQMEESFKDLDLSALENLQKLDLSGLEGLKDLNFDWGFTSGAIL